MSDPHADLRALLARLDIDECKCQLELDCPCRQDCPVIQPDCPFCWRDANPDFLGPPVPGPRCSAHCPHCGELCDCPPAEFQPPCIHTSRIVNDQDLFWLADSYFRLIGGEASTVGEMVAELKEWLNPGEYRAPPQGDPESIATDTESRVAVMARRNREGQHIAHPMDRFRKATSSTAVLADRGRNGAVKEGETIHA